MILTILSALLIALITILIKYRAPDPLPDIPVAPGRLPVIGHLIVLIKNAHRWTEWKIEATRSIKQSNDSSNNSAECWQFMFWGEKNCIVEMTSPRMVESMLNQSFNHFVKNFERLTDLLGGGIFASNHNEWKKQRKLIARLFSQRSINQSINLILKGLMDEQMQQFDCLIDRHLEKSNPQPCNNSVQKSASNILMNQSIDKIIKQSINHGPTVELQSVFHSLTFDTILRLTFGDMPISLSDRLVFNQTFDQSINLSTLRFIGPPQLYRFKKFFKIGSERDLAENLTKLDEIVNRLCDQKREIYYQSAKQSNYQSNNQSDIQSHNQTATSAQSNSLPSNVPKCELPDMMSMFIEQSLNDANVQSSDNTLSTSPMNQSNNQTIQQSFTRSLAQPTTKEMRDFVINLLIAGRDTTATALTYMFWRITRPSNRLLMNRLINEIDRYWERSNNPSIDQSNNYVNQSVDHLPLLYAVIYETLRLHPPIPVEAKQVSIDQSVSQSSDKSNNRQSIEMPDGSLLPNGSLCFYSIAMLQRSNQVFDRPDEFIPERWFDHSDNMSNNPSNKQSINQSINHSIDPHFVHTHDPFSGAGVCPFLKLNKQSNSQQTIDQSKYVSAISTVSGTSHWHSSINRAVNPSAQQSINQPTFVPMNSYVLPVFNAGKRQCLGKSLAISEIIYISLNLLRFYRFDRVENQPADCSMDSTAAADCDKDPEVVPSLTLKMKHGMNVKISRRSDVHVQ